MSKSWYVIHTYSGFEGRVKATIEEKVTSMGMKEKIGQVLIPTENVVEIRDGKKRISAKKFFPGYVLIEMEFTEDTLQLIKDVPKVTGFVGGGEKPLPLSEEEIQTLMKHMDTGTPASKEKVRFHKGDKVRIIDGPFIGFNGMVDEIHPEQSKLKVLVSIFGRSTPVELGFHQVESQ